MAAARVEFCGILTSANRVLSERERKRRRIEHEEHEEHKEEPCDFAAGMISRPGAQARYDLTQSRQGAKARIFLVG